MKEPTSPEFIRPMKQLGEDAPFDPYDIDVSEAEEQAFQDNLAAIDAATSYDFGPRT